MKTDKDLPKFHAKFKAPMARKKRCKEWKQAYNLIVEQWLFMHKELLFHPKMPELKRHFMDTIVHNIGWMVAEQITKFYSLQKK